MAVETTLELFIAADQSLIIDVKQSDLTTPQTMTGWAEEFVLRSGDGRLVVSKTVSGGGITIGNGSGTGDRATITVADTDTTGWPAGRGYTWGLWRTDNGTDVPLAYGSATLKQVATQTAP